MRHAVIMAGGSGTRLWPLSRAGRPKQLLDVIGDPDGGTAGGGQDSSAPQTFQITVNAVNDAPANSVPGPQTTSVCSGLATAESRSTVCCSSERCPVSGSRNFGWAARLSGHSRVPEPPAMITACRMSAPRPVLRRGSPRPPT